MEYLGYAADVIGIVGSVLSAVFAILAWRKAGQVQQELRREQDRQRKQVTVVLQHGPEQYKLPIQLQRAELTRAEVLGVLGMIPLKNPEKNNRFKIGFVSTKDFLDEINDIITRQGDAILRIPSTKEEYEQFDLAAFQRKTP